MPDLTGATIPEPHLPFMAALDSEPGIVICLIQNLVNMAAILPDFPSLPMSTDPVISGAGSSTSAPSMTAGHEVGSGENIVSGGDTFGAIQSTIFPSYSESTGAAGVSMPLTAVNPSMIAPQPGPPVVKKPNKMRPNGSSTARSVCLFRNLKSA
jgi:hypothetical protein